MYLIIFLLIIVPPIEIFFKPRFDFTQDEKLLLWYGKKNRNYIIIFNKKL